MLSVISVAGAFGLDVNSVEAGSLKSVISNPSAVTTLVVSGPVDASDLYFIGSEMKALKSLDLSGVSIEAYKGVKLHGASAYPAATIPAGAFSGLGLNSVKYPATTGLTIGDGAFMNTALTVVSLPANIDSVGTGAFAACANLRTVTMPDVRMGVAVFADCPALTTVDMGSATVIPDGTFRGCSALATVKGSEKVVGIGDRAFEGDKALTDFAFGRSLRHLGASAFAGTGLKTVDLANATALDVIGEQAFAGTEVETVELSGNLSALGAGAFFGDANLSAIELPAGLITIGDHAFNGTRLTDLNLPTTLEEIGNYALADQSGISEIVLPPALIRIGDYAMEDMTGLKRIDATATQSVPELGENVWAGVDQPAVKLAIYKDYETAYRAADQWNKFEFEIQTGSDVTIADGVTAPEVRARFVGDDLHIESDGADIDVVRLFDTAGRLLMSVEPRDMTAVLDTAGLSGRVFVVTITLDNGMTSSLKLARR